MSVETQSVARGALFLMTLLAVLAVALDSVVVMVVVCIVGIAAQLAVVGDETDEPVAPERMTYEDPAGLMVAVEIPDGMSIDEVREAVDEAVERRLSVASWIDPRGGER